MYGMPNTMQTQGWYKSESNSPCIFLTLEYEVVCPLLNTGREYASCASCRQCQTEVKEHFKKICIFCNKCVFISAMPLLDLSESSFSRSCCDSSLPIKFLLTNHLPINMTIFIMYMNCHSIIHIKLPDCLLLVCVHWLSSSMSCQFLLCTISHSLCREIFTFCHGWSGKGDESNGLAC